MSRSFWARTGAGEMGSSFGTGTKPSSSRFAPPPADGEAVPSSDCAMGEVTKNKLKTLLFNTRIGYSYLYSTSTLTHHRASSRTIDQSKIATALVHPPDPPLTVTGKATTVNPVAGSFSKLANFSIWQYGASRPAL